MNSSNANQSATNSDVIVQTIRLDKSKLTEKAIELCNLTQTDRILDLGCGMGLTISYLYNKYCIKAVGIDPSDKLLNIAKENCDFAYFIKGSGESIPFENESFDYIISECALSFMEDINATIQEVNRVLTKNGWFVVTDVYSKKQIRLQELAGYCVLGDRSGLQGLSLLQHIIEKIGFKVWYLGDYSNYEQGYFVMLAKK